MYYSHVKLGASLLQPQTNGAFEVVGIDHRAFLADINQALVSHLLCDRSGLLHERPPVSRPDLAWNLTGSAGAAGLAVLQSLEDFCSQLGSN